MILLLGMHLLQVVVDGAYRAPREMNFWFGLILLHLPPPHTPGAYLPDPDRFTIRGLPGVASYFNNLALADRWLGKLRQAMQDAGRWDKMWVILSADHSWRTSTIYDGRRDLRVPFLIKSPGSERSVTYPREFNTVVTHDLILAALRGEISDQQQTVAWLDANAIAQPTTTGQGQDEH